jgi:uncharacterized protein YbdZ (MbtH family)
MSWYDPDQEDLTIYKVVVNHEEQYSIWPADKENPLGWSDAGRSGPKAECLAYVKEVWTDMRPLSLRRKMEDAARNPPPPVEPAPETDAEESLVDRLAQGRHPIEASLRPASTVDALKERIDRGYVYVRFTGTRGGTELGVRLDREATDLTGADFERQTGTAHLVGGLTLDYVPVRCIADIDLQTLKGNGRLEKVAP